MNRKEKLELIAIYEEKIRRRLTRKMHSYYPDDGPLKRENYGKHLEFFAAGKYHQERAAIAGNRCGKTTLGCYESTVHLTGLYPKWWDGHVFSGPVDWWAASDTSETTRDILQKEFMGPINAIGTGMIPGDHIIDRSLRRGVSDAFDTVTIKHKSGGISTLGFKSYDQGREKFQGTAKHGITLDEEPDAKIYYECLTRLMTTNGLMLCTFTPLKGMSEIVMRYLSQYEKPEQT